MQFLPVALAFLVFRNGSALIAAEPAPTRDPTILARNMVIQESLPIYATVGHKMYMAKIETMTVSDGGIAQLRLRTYANVRLDPKHPNPKNQEELEYIRGENEKRVLTWSWTQTGRLIPFLVGQLVFVHVDPKGIVRRIHASLTASNTLKAFRKHEDGTWELLAVETGNGRTPDVESRKEDPKPRQETFFAHLVLDYWDDNGFELEWTDRYGLALGRFLSGYGDASVAEEEKRGKDWPGWAVDNEPGKHIKPGRDGWLAAYRVVGKGDDAYYVKAFQWSVPDKQYLPYDERDDELQKKLR